MAFDVLPWILKIKSNENNMEATTMDQECREKFGRDP